MIYKFTDTAKRATPGTLPGEALFINGQAIENLIEGYRTLYVKGRESMSAEINLAEQGRADGGGFNYKRYPARHYSPDKNNSAQIHSPAKKLQVAAGNYQTVKSRLNRTTVFYNIRQSWIQINMGFYIRFNLPMA